MKSFGGTRFQVQQCVVKRHTYTPMYTPLPSTLITDLGFLLIVTAQENIMLCLVSSKK